MSYEQALLSIHSATENASTYLQKMKAERARRKEEEVKSLAGMLGKGLGRLLAGPGGGEVGEFAFKEVADFFIKSEDIKIDPGKFNVLADNEYNKGLDDWDRETDIADWINLGTGMVTAYEQAGGFEDRDGEPLDLTKWWTDEGAKTSLEMIGFGKKDTTLSKGEEGPSPFEAFDFPKDDDVQIIPQATTSTLTEHFKTGVEQETSFENLAQLVFSSDTTGDFENTRIKKLIEMGAGQDPLEYLSTLHGIVGDSSTQTSREGSHPDYSGLSFNKAFSKARAAGDLFFWWNGELKKVVMK